MAKRLEIIDGKPVEIELTPEEEAENVAQRQMLVNEENKRQVRKQKFQDFDTDDDKNFLEDMLVKDSPRQIDTWVNSKVNNLQQVKLVLKMILKYIAWDLKRRRVRDIR